MPTTSRDSMIEHAVAAAERGDTTNGLRARVIRAAGARWPADIADTAQGRGTLSKSLTALIDADVATLRALAPQLGIEV